MSDHPLTRAEQIAQYALLVLGLCAVATAAGVLVLTGSLDALAITAIGAGVASVPLGLTLVTTLLQPAADRRVEDAARTLATPSEKSSEQARLRRAA